VRTLFGAPKAPSWYREWRALAFDELLTKQGQLETEQQLGAWPRYDYDLEHGSLTFSDESGPRVVAEVEAVGTTSAKDWLWSWANESLPRSSTGAAPQVRAFGAEHRIDELVSRSVKAEKPEQLGWELMAAAVKVVEAMGGYKCPAKTGGALFLLIRSIRFVS
jgi:hypothetical protein